MQPIVTLVLGALAVFGLATILRIMITWVITGAPMSQPESKLSRQIMEHIRARGGMVWKNHGGPLTMSGLPDITGVYRSHMIGIETKMPEGRGPSAIQRYRHREIEAAGGHVIVARSVADVELWLDTFRWPWETSTDTVPPITPTNGG